MMLKRLVSVFIGIILVSTPLCGKRHSRTKTREPLEKYTPKKEHTLDLREILSRQTKDLTFEQAQIAREYYQKEKNDEMIAKCAERMLAIGGDQELMRTARLELATIFLDKKNYKEAEKYALEYQKYYPGAAETKKAAYIAIQANYLSKLSSDRDQEKTKTTVTLAKEFLTNYKDDTEYSSLIQTMLDDCYKSLIRAELRVIDLQLNSYNYTGNEISLNAAEKRLAFIQETLLPHASVAEKKVASLETELKKLRQKIAPAPVAPTQENKTENKTEAQKEVAPEKQQGYYEAVKDFFFEDNNSFFDA